ncbi:SusD/RagB family nutrient-binding outer membrane lipoprotein [Membranihabitans maritimus]|uniref:SusD/RagB family nutrient-binding outer membrane lipoprotein n=1 Tax=Membranihabitans maritimus TaxID=2904244 RepID=UPI001F349820|nr:SusD/RagB family nutrient-binding outer membrane lipoprotein [Membranihabitans maritimus]
MKLLYYILIPILLLTSACEDFEEINTSPNNPEEVSSNFILTYVLSETAKLYESQGRYDYNISGAMQYTQRGTEFNSTGPNFYGWDNESWSGYYNVLRNNQIIYDNAVEENNPSFQGVALVMKSLVFGLLTDLYGDIPYSQSLEASNDVFFPSYDDQKSVYIGILNDLREADQILSDSQTADYPINASSDIYYGGNVDQWRKFANSLRMRYAMRLYNKKSEVSEIDLASEFQSASAHTFESNDDNAVMEYVGTTEDNSAPGGSLRSANPNFSVKASLTLIETLRNINDPRLERWVSPALKKWDSNVNTIRDTVVTNIYGEQYTVTLMPPDGEGLDTSIYVGLPIGLPSIEAINYNIGEDEEFFDPEKNPHISFLHDRYRLNKEELVDVKLITYSEVNFLLAEAVLKGDMGISGDAETYYREGIEASMEDWKVFRDAIGFNFDNYYASENVDLSLAEDKLERVMEQKWIAGWLQPESWFDWRRTGFPELETGEITQFGDAIPIRYIYPTPNLDPNYLVNYESAIEKLEATGFVPVGQSKDHHYSRMWLLQGTGKPW